MNVKEMYDRQRIARILALALARKIVMQLDAETITRIDEAYAQLKLAKNKLCNEVYRVTDGVQLTKL